MSSFALLRSFSTDTQPTTPQQQQQIPAPNRRKMNKRFSFHQKQNQSVKEPMENHNAQKKSSKSKLTRRWSSLKQYQTTTLSQQSLASSSSPFASVNPSPLHNTNGSNSGATPVSDVKKKWEVIEHYKGSVNGRDAISSSLLAVSDKFKN
jgi:hypothetical protein